MIKRLSLAAASAALLGVGALSAAAPAQTPTCPPGTTQQGDYCVNHAGKVLPGVVYKVRPGQDKKAAGAAVTAARSSKARSFTTLGYITYGTRVKKTHKGCQGKVAVTIRDGKKQVSKKVTKVRWYKKHCRFHTTTKFGHKKFKNRKLTFLVRFRGNSVLKPRTPKSKHIRIR